MTPRHTLSDAERALFLAPNFAIVSTLRADGSILSVSIWVDVDSDDIILNSEVTRAWPKNAQERTEITVTVTDRDDPYRYVSVSGSVTSAETDGAFEHGDRMAKKYLGKDKYPFHSEGDVRVVPRVTPTRVFSSGV